MVGFRLVENKLVGGAPLCLVAIEQRAAAPALLESGDLPANVDAVGDPHVHAKPAERGMKVTSIANQKHPSVAIAVGQQPARDPFVRAEDFVWQVDAGGSADRRHCLFIGKRNPGFKRAWHEKPQVALVHRADQARHIVIDLPVHDRGALAVCFGETRSTKDDVIVARKAISANHLRADVVTDLAAGSICTDQKTRAQLADLARRRIAIAGLNATLVLGEVEVLGVVAELDRRQRQGMGAQHVFELVLRNPLAVLGKALIACGRALQGIFELFDQLAAEAGHESHIARIVDPERGCRGKFVGNTPAPQVFAGARMGCLGAWRITAALGAFEDDAGYAPPAQFDRRGETGRSRPDDCYRALFLCLRHALSHSNLWFEAILDGRLNRTG